MASKPPPPATNRPVTVAALLLALFMAATEMTVVSTAMPTVVAELGGALHYAWVFSAYMLTSTVTVPVYGKLADLYGRKPMLLAAIAIFLAGSMASGQATSMNQLIVFRALQGLGAGGMQPLALTVIGDIFDVRERAKMQGLFGAVWALAGLTGPLIGGLIVSVLSWRWVFYVNVPFGIVAGAALSMALVEKIEPRSHGLDIAGAALLSGSVVSLLLGTDGVVPWVLLPASIVLGGAFIAVERRAREPVVPLDLFAQPILATTNMMQALSGSGVIGLMTFVPLYAQGVLGGTPTEAGAAIAPMAVSWPIMSAVSGRLIPYIGFRALVRFGAVVVAISSVALALSVSAGASHTTLRLGSAAFGIGMGLSNTAMVIAVQTSVGFSQRGVATASTMFFRNIGGTVGVGVMGVVLSRVLMKAGGNVDPGEVVARLLRPAHAKGPSAAGEAQALGAIAADLARGLSWVVWIIAGLTMVSVVVAWFFPRDAEAAKPAAD